MNNSLSEDVQPLPADLAELMAEVDATPGWQVRQGSGAVVHVLRKGKPVYKFQHGGQEDPHVLGQVRLALINRDWDENAGAEALRAERSASAAVAPKPVITRPGDPVKIAVEAPQRLTLEQLLPPEGGDGGQRYTIPSVVVTPEIARAFHERRTDTHNRRIRPANVRYFKRTILAGKFGNTHQGLAFDVNGHLADGGHRTLAMIELAEFSKNAGLEIVVDITYNMPVEESFNYDGGASRINADHLSVYGVKQPRQVSPLLSLLHQYEQAREEPQRWSRVPKLLPHEFAEYGEKHGPGLQEAWSQVQVLRKKYGFNIGAFAVSVYEAKQWWPGGYREVNGKRVHAVELFIRDVVALAGAESNSPMHRLRDWGQENMAYDRKTTPAQNMAMFLTAYNAYCAGRKAMPKKLTWLPGDGVPLPFTPPENHL